jgi:peptidyl-dipeptidase Dcp
MHDIRQLRADPAAFDAALAEARGNIAAIAADAAVPTFSNTIAALELAEGSLDRVSGVFYNLAGADSTEAREALISSPPSRQGASRG